MICTNCFEADNATTTTDMTVTINGVPHVITVECEKCPECDEITFTHAQSLEVDKKRIALEFGNKPILSPQQLKTLRQFLKMTLDEICDVLQIGKNSYGRWERGEIEITPSMNLLVHNFIEKVPNAKIHIFASERNYAISKANETLVSKPISFGEYIRTVVNVTSLVREIICNIIKVDSVLFFRIENNDILPDRVDVETNARIGHFFRLSIQQLNTFLNNSMQIHQMKSTVSAVHARSTSFDDKCSGIQASSINKIMEKLAQKQSQPSQTKVSDEYIKKLGEALEKLYSTMG